MDSNNVELLGIQYYCFIDNFHDLYLRRIVQIQLIHYILIIGHFSDVGNSLHISNSLTFKHAECTIFSQNSSTTLFLIR